MTDRMPPTTRRRSSQRLVKTKGTKRSLERTSSFRSNGKVKSERQKNPSGVADPILIDDSRKAPSPTKVAQSGPQMQSNGQDHSDMVSPSLRPSLGPSSSPSLRPCLSQKARSASLPTNLLPTNGNGEDELTQLKAVSQAVSKPRLARRVSFSAETKGEQGTGETSPSLSLNTRANRFAHLRIQSPRVDTTTFANVFRMNDKAPRESTNLHKAIANAELASLRTAIEDIQSSDSLNAENGSSVTDSDESPVLAPTPTPKLIDAGDKICGATALMRAAELEPKDSTEVIGSDGYPLALRFCDLLLQAGASLFPQDDGGNSCLHYAAASGNVNVVRYLCKQGAKIECKNESGETAVFVAARYGQVGALKALIEDFGSNPLSLNKDGEMVFDVAGRMNELVHANDRVDIQTCMLSMFPQLRTLVLHHIDCLEHDTAAGHQESPKRIEAILELLRPQNSEAYMHTNTSDKTEKVGGQGSDVTKKYAMTAIALSDDFSTATSNQIRRVHYGAYAKFLDDLTEQAALKGAPIPLTPRIQVGLHGADQTQAKDEASCDTSFSEGTVKAARRACGAVVHAVDQIMHGKCRNSFCVVRPPGHHAGTAGLLCSSFSCGFCIFNNVMVGALHAMDTYPEEIQKVAIIDIDAHHGNGTEEILLNTAKPDRFFFASFHVFDGQFYPGTGKEDIISCNIINSAIDPLWKKSSTNPQYATGACLRGMEKKYRSGRIGFRQQMTQRVLPALRAFSPDIIFISAGFDGGKHDIGNRQGGRRQGVIGMDLLPLDYAWIAHQLKSVANFCCKGRLVSVLEGGYGRVDTKAPPPPRSQPLRSGRKQFNQSKTDAVEKNEIKETVSSSQKPLYLGDFARCAEAHVQSLAGNLESLGIVNEPQDLPCRMNGGSPAELPPPAIDTSPATSRSESRSQSFSSNEDSFPPRSNSEDSVDSSKPRKSARSRKKNTLIHYGDVTPRPKSSRTRS